MFFLHFCDILSVETITNCGNQHPCHFQTRTDIHLLPNLVMLNIFCYQWHVFCYTLSFHFLAIILLITAMLVIAENYRPVINPFKLDQYFIQTIASKGLIDCYFCQYQLIYLGATKFGNSNGTTKISNILYFLCNALFYYWQPKWFVDFCNSYITGLLLLVAILPLLFIAYILIISSWWVKL